VDLFASEYGWSVETIMSMPPDQKAELYHAILHRRGMRALRMSFAPGEAKESLASRSKAIFDTPLQT
jgi:hypothetical protein